MTTPEAPSETTPAATVVLLRDEPGGPTTLMLRRNPEGAFGGMWVFPGGRVEDADRTDDDDDERWARQAAVREAVEECALRLEPHELVSFSHWTPPPSTGRRFATWFFVARAADGDVLIDGHEIHDHTWLPPAEVLARRDAGELDLAPPTYVTLHDLASATTVDDALAMASSRRPVPRYASRLVRSDEGPVILWPGDAGYAESDLGAAGRRHRLWMLSAGWRYERS
ncbi:MAG: NUDIX hydrolase [Acidimicrobiales bacterium]|nr:NUDIX hydrolase [Acidimicrobiales bacterium]